MLKKAESKGCYDQLEVMNAENTSIVESTYDATICVGALNFGHILPSAFNEFIRITKKDGLISFTTRMDYYTTLSKDVQEQLVQEKKWELVEKRHYGDEAVKDMEHIHWCYKKL